MRQSAGVVVALQIVALLADTCNLDGPGCAPPVHVAGLVLARGGSKGIPNKNLQEIQGESLLGRTLRILKLVQGLSSVWVSTDSATLSAVAEKGGAQTHWRHSATATDNATSLSGVQEFLYHRPEIDVVVLVQCTSPFLQSEDVQRALQLLSGPAECVFTVSRSHSLRWEISPDGFATPLNFDPENRPRRQDWAGELIETGMLYVMKRELVWRGQLQSDRCRVVEIPRDRALEIDSQHDLETARLLLNAKP